MNASLAFAVVAVAAGSGSHARLATQDLRVGDGVHHVGALHLAAINGLGRGLALAGLALNYAAHLRRHLLGCQHMARMALVRANVLRRSLRLFGSILDSRAMQHAVHRVIVETIRSRIVHRHARVLNEQVLQWVRQMIRPPVNGSKDGRRSEDPALTRMHIDVMHGRLSQTSLSIAAALRGSQGHSFLLVQDATCFIHKQTPTFIDS